MSKSEPRAPSAGAPSAAEQLHGAGGGLWACSCFPFRFRKVKRANSAPKCTSSHPTRYQLRVLQLPVDLGNTALFARRRHFRGIWELSFSSGHSSGDVSPPQAPSSPSQAQKGALDTFQELHGLIPIPGAGVSPASPARPSQDTQGAPPHPQTKVYRLHLAQRKVLISHSE